jgi:hypothetical protein
VDGRKSPIEEIEREALGKELEGLDGYVKLILMIFEK